MTITPLARPSASLQPHLTGKVIVVTGAGSGIGRAIALQCAAEGAQVALADIELASAHASLQLLDDSQRERAITIHADVSSARDVAAMVSETVRRFGRIDGCVANAGVFGIPYPVLDTPLESWEAALRVNLTGTFLTLQEVGRVLLRQGGHGSMIAIGSSLGVRPIGGNIGYSAAKAAVHLTVRAMALELAQHQIRVNAIIPGVTVTPATTSIPGYLEHVSEQLPLHAPAQPQEIAELAVQLLSDALPHMTGSLVSLDSGVTAG